MFGPAGGAYSAPPGPLAGFKGPILLKGGERREGREEIGEGRSGGGRNGEGRGICVIGLTGDGRHW